MVEGLAQRIAEGKVGGCGSVGGFEKQMGRSLLDHVSSNLDIDSDAKKVAETLRSGIFSSSWQLMGFSISEVFELGLS